MVKEIRAWRAKDGTLFDDFAKAARHDLYQSIAVLIQDQIPFSTGGVIMDKVVSLLIENTHILLPAMTEYLKAVPPTVPPNPTGA